MATQKDYELAEQAEAKRAMNPLYQATLEERQAIDAVTLEQAKKEEKTKEAEQAKEEAAKAAEVAQAEAEAAKAVEAEKAAQAEQAAQESTQAQGGKERARNIAPPPVIKTYGEQEQWHLRNKVEGFLDQGENRSQHYGREYREKMNAAIDAEYGKGSLRATQAKIFLSEKINTPEMREALSNEAGYSQAITGDSIEDFKKHEAAAHRQREQELAQELQQQLAAQELDHDNAHGLER